MKKKTVTTLLLAVALATAPTVAVLSPDKVMAAEQKTIESGNYQYAGSTDIYVYNADDNSLIVSDDTAKYPDITEVTWSAFGEDTIEQIKHNARKVSFDNTLKGDISALLMSYRSAVSYDFSGADTSNVTSMALLFSNSPSSATVETINLAGIDTSNVTDMSYMFENNYSLTHIDVSNFNTSNVTNMSYMFDCIPVGSLDLSSFDTSKVTNFSGFIRDCENLKTLDISGFTINESANVRSFFFGDSKLDIIKCPATIRKAVELPITDYQGQDYYDIAEDMTSKTVYQSLTATNEDMTIRAYRQLNIAYDLDDTGRANFPKKDTGNTEFIWDITYRNYKVGEKADVLEHLSSYELSDYNLVSDRYITITDEATTHTTAKFKTKEYTVRFLDQDGKVLKTETVKIHNGATAPTEPTREADGYNTYEFSGWDKDFTEITENTDITATYVATPIPTEPTPVEPTPVEPTPVEPTPTEPTPVTQSLYKASPKMGDVTPILPIMGTGISGLLALIFGRKRK